MKMTKLVLSAFAAIAMTFGGVSLMNVQQAEACGGDKTMAKLTTVDVPVDGMDCDGCAGKIAAALENVDGITTATVSFADKMAKITYDANKIGVEQIVAEIQKAGYKTGKPGQARQT